MQKTVYSLFVLLTVFSIIAITPSAFADHSKVDINMVVGSSNVGCETNNMCYMPYNAALDPGGEAMWHNIDDMAHTVSSGTPAEGLDDIFDSGLVPAGGMFSYKFEETGTYDYFCMVHPWMTGIVTVPGRKHEFVSSQPGTDEPDAFVTVACMTDGSMTWAGGSGVSTGASTAATDDSTITVPCIQG